MVNGHKSAAYTDLPDGDTSKMSLGRGMHCPSASSLYWFLNSKQGTEMVQVTPLRRTLASSP